MFKRVVLSATGALLALSIGAAGAYFATQVQVPDSVVRAGTVAVSTEPTTAPLSVDALAPGTTCTRPFTVLNTGTLPVDVTVTALKKAGVTEFYDALTCTVMCANTQIYSGKLSALKTTALRLEPGARGDMRFEIGLPPEVGNSLAGDYAKISLYVDGEQSR